MEPFAIQPPSHTQSPPSSPKGAFVYHHLHRKFQAHKETSSLLVSLVLLLWDLGIFFSFKISVCSMFTNGHETIFDELKLVLSFTFLNIFTWEESNSSLSLKVQPEFWGRDLCVSFSEDFTTGHTVKRIGA